MALLMTAGHAVPNMQSRPCLYVTTYVCLKEIPRLGTYVCMYMNEYLDAQVTCTDGMHIIANVTWTCSVRAWSVPGRDRTSQVCTGPATVVLGLALPTRTRMYYSYSVPSLHSRYCCVHSSAPPPRPARSRKSHGAIGLLSPHDAAGYVPVVFLAHVSSFDVPHAHFRVGAAPGSGRAGCWSSQPSGARALSLPGCTAP